MEAITLAILGALTAGASYVYLDVRRSLSKNTTELMKCIKERERCQTILERVEERLNGEAA